MLEPVKHVLVIVEGSCTGPNLTNFFVFISSDKKKAEHKECYKCKEGLTENFCIKIENFEL